MDICYGLANYPDIKEAKEWIRSNMGKIQISKEINSSQTIDSQKYLS